ncbi:MAG: DNA helicase UvrD [Candidatus Omnitrophota bacterium]|nr:MAG: DNA helicase UvrD [Candidatus Omnitrophota bacterium]
MIVIDLHIHSKYSRATSRDMDLDHLSEFAKLKGIDVLGTGDFTHFLWLQELKSKLTPKSYGIYEYKGTHYILTAEVSNIYSQQGRLRKIHNLIMAPSFEVVERINAQLVKFGNLSADGRPILGLSAKDLVEIVLSIDENCIIIPCHIWTPWFSLFGSNSGFDDIEECFGPYTKYIYALETGLSSDPAMNWRLSKLDSYILVSNSDSHSPSRIGREANVLNTKIDYMEIITAMKNKDKSKFLYTIEFYPQEGKYHYDGHRNCGISLSPRESMKLNNICPVCKRPLTIGVMHRVEQLADREEGVVPESAIPFKNLIPLDEIIAETKGVQKNAQSVIAEYRSLIQGFGSELEILLHMEEDFLRENLPSKLAEGIIRVRNGNVKIEPGYDGVYGKIKVFDDQEQGRGGEKQLSLF